MDSLTKSQPEIGLERFTRRDTNVEQCVECVLITAAGVVKCMKCAKPAWDNGRAGLTAAVKAVSQQVANSARTTRQYLTAVAEVNKGGTSGYMAGFVDKSRDRARYHLG